MLNLKCVRKTCVEVVSYAFSQSSAFVKFIPSSSKYLSAIAAGLLLLSAASMTFAATIPPASTTSAGAQGGKHAKTCHPGAKDLSGCTIHFVIPPPQIVIGASSIKIGGADLPFEVREYMIKNALHRSWSSSAEDRMLMVCSWTSSFKGSRIKDRIRCETNEAHAWAAQDTQDTYVEGAGGSTSCPSAPMVSSGLFDVSRAMAACIMAEVVQWANTQYSSTLVSGMSKLPRAGSDYTIKVKKNGQVTSKWMFEKGQLVAVWHKRNIKGQ